MKPQHQIIIAGSGGQGIVVTGQLLAQAVLLENKNAVQTQSYGIAQRGGFCAAEVIVDSNEILFQQVEEPDVVVILGLDALPRYASTDARVLYDSAMLTPPEGATAWTGIPFSRIAEQGGNSRMTNMVAAGAVIAMTGVVRLESFLSVLTYFKASIREQNIQAVQTGYAAWRELHPQGVSHDS